MKKMQYRMWFIWVLLPLLLISCGKKEPNDNILTGLYGSVLEELGTENTTKASAMVPYGDGYAFVRVDQDESYQESMTIVQVDEKGQQTEIPVKMERYGNAYKAGERGVYTFVLSGNNQYDLVMIGWDGTVLAQENISANKPSSATTTTPQAATLLTSLPLAETEDGLVLTWGKALLYLDRDLHHIETIDLPGQGDMVFVEGNTIWVSYAEGNERTLGKVQDKTLVESYLMPEKFTGINTYYWLRLIDCRDGWLYAWDTTSVVRWKYGAKEETIETVLDFLGSGLFGQRIRLITMQDKERFCIQTSTDNGLHVAVGLYDKAPDKDLSQMTVLTLATVTNTSEMEEAVLQFNKTHSDSYLKLVSYEQYNTDDEPSKGYTLFMTDLTTGILQADILYGDTSDAMDLYPLMTGTVQKEDIAPCVRRALEKDGKLTSIGSTFYVSTLVGKTDAVPEKFTLETILEFVETLSEEQTAYLMEELGWENASYTLFGNHGYDSFLQNGVHFDDPLFDRMLTFLSSLPKEGEKYAVERIDNSAALLAGEITEEQLVVESGGENLYWDGKIKLVQSSHLQTPRDIMKLYAIFGTTELTLTGYPTVTEEQNGIQVHCVGNYSIPQNCKDPALAWEFIESILLRAAQIPTTDSVTNTENLRADFTTLTAPYMEYLQSLQNCKQFVTGDDKVYTGSNIVLDDKGQYQGRQGLLLDVGDALADLVAMLYAEAGDSYAVPYDITNIISEEVSRYLSGGCDAKTCAEATQSRVQLYLDENS